MMLALILFSWFQLVNGGEFVGGSVHPVSPSGGVSVFNHTQSAPDTVTIAISMDNVLSSGWLDANNPLADPKWNYPYTVNYVYDDSVQTLFQYAHMDTTSPTVCIGDGRECRIYANTDGGEDEAGNSGRMIVRFDINELVPSGADVIDADLYLSLHGRTIWPGLPMLSGGGFVAVLDTLVEDYWWSEINTCNNAWQVASFWSQMRTTDPKEWQPALSERATGADFGVTGTIRADFDPYTTASEDTINLDVLSLVEGIVESGWHNSGFWLTVIDDNQLFHEINCGTLGQSSDRNPTLYITYVTTGSVAFNSEKPWDGSELAMVFSMDGADKLLGQQDWIDVADSLGVKLTVYTDERKVGANTNKFTYSDLQALATSGHDVGYMGLWHASVTGGYAATSYGMMGLCDPDSLGPATNMWMWDNPWTTGMGTSAFSATPMLAWPGYVYNDTLIAKVIAAGFGAARSGPLSSNYSAWNDHPDACWDEVDRGPTLMTWDDPVKMYEIGLSQNVSKISGLQAENPTRPMVVARVDSIITAAIAAGNNPVIRFYGHKNKTNGGEIDRDEFTWAIHRYMWDDRVTVTTDSRSVELYKARHVSADGGITWN